jgi:hypothetical protein
MKRIFIVGLLLITLIIVGGCSNDPLTDDVYSEASYIKVDSSGNGGYWRIQYRDAIATYSTGTQIPPNISSLGGYRLDAIGEVLYFNANVEDDWDEVGDAVVEIYFEVNADNTGGADTDTVKFQLECWHKIISELGNTVYSLEGNTVVGTSDQHELFKQSITISNVRLNEIIAFRINLNTIDSDVDSVIVNYIAFKYPTYYPELEL